MPGGKPRMLLALLGLEAGRMVSLDRIVGTLWAVRPPPIAAKVAHRYLSRRLRAAPWPRS